METRDMSSTRYGVDINDIDFDWIKKCTNVKKLRAAIRLLKEDGFYPDLLKHAEEKLCELDPEYKRRKELPHATYDDKKAAEKEIESFLNEFENPHDNMDEQKKKLEDAKDERLKGNECMASKDYKEAVRFYERSLKLDPSEAATYSNRALAYLKLNDHKNALNDANIAISMAPEYIKAYHRRAEAYLGLADYMKAYVDAKAILEIEPQNSGVKETMDKIMKKAKNSKFEFNEEEAKNKADEIIKKIKETKPKAEAPKKQAEPKKEVKKAEPEKKEEKSKDGFVKINITEDADESSESDEEKEVKQEQKSTKMTIEEPKDKKSENIWNDSEIKTSEPIQSKTEIKKEEIFQINPEELEKLFATFNFHKEEGNKLHKAGSYEEAVKRYLQSLEFLEQLQKSNNKIPNDEFLKRDAIVNSNIAVAYKQLQDSSNVIKYATKTIDAGDKIEQAVLLKALILRAYAYESVDKLLLAKDDWTKVKEIQWDNSDASHALERINDAFKRDKAAKIGEMLKSIQKDLEEFKKSGNEEYKAGNHLKAIEKFTNGIELFLSKCDQENMQFVPKELLQIVTQLYTNRAICNHVLNRHLDVVDDAAFVINKLDPKNAKAYYRRGVAMNKLGDCENALIDLQKAADLDPNNPLIKEELKTVLTLVIENRKKQPKQAEQKPVEKPDQTKISPQPEQPKNEPKPTAKISEITEPISAQKPESKQVKKPAKPKKISEEQISKAAQLAAQNLGKEFNAKPKTAYAFENVWRSYKNNYAELSKFLKENADPDYLVNLFKENELPTEIYLQIIKTLKFDYKQYFLLLR